MKKLVDAMLVAALLAANVPGVAENLPEPPPAAQGEMTPPGDDQAPPEGTPPAPPEGEAPPQGAGQMPPEGGMRPGPGGPGMAAAPETYAAVRTVTGQETISGEEIASTGADENALCVTSGSLTMTDGRVTRASADSAGGDQASFYGVGAAVLVTGGTANLADCDIATDAAGGAGVFAYGDGSAEVSDCTITTEQGASGGVHVAGGGTLHASNLTVTTHGESSAAIRSDRGGGTLTVEGGTDTTTGSGSPAVYVTADVTVRGAALTATGSEALCLEGRNAVHLADCQVSGSLPDLPQNDNTWTVIVYQSMSGDSEVGKGTFEMIGGSLRSTNGGLFYTTNTESEFVLAGVDIDAPEADYFLRCTGNANRRGWGQSGSNGAKCVFTGIGQEMTGDVLWDSISELTLNVCEGSVLDGAVTQDERFAGEGGDGWARVTIDADSAWIVTGDSRVTALRCDGQLVDETGLPVRVVGTDGTVYVDGESDVTVTVDAYGE